MGPGCLNSILLCVAIALLAFVALRPNSQQAQGQMMSPTEMKGMEDMLICATPWPNSNQTALFLIDPKTRTLAMYVTKQNSGFALRSVRYIGYDLRRTEMNPDTDHKQRGHTVRDMTKDADPAPALDIATQVGLQAIAMQGPSRDISLYLISPANKNIAYYAAGENDPIRLRQARFYKNDFAFYPKEITAKDTENDDEKPLGRNNNGVSAKDAKKEAEKLNK